MGAQALQDAPAGRGVVVLRLSIHCVSGNVACQRRTCALRAPTVVSVRISSASVPKPRFSIKTRTGRRFCSRSSIACGCAFHPRAVGDPRGRAAVRASSGVAARGILSRPPASPNGHCALCAPTVFSARIKSASAQKTRLYMKTSAASRPRNITLCKKKATGELYSSRRL